MQLSKKKLYNKKPRSDCGHYEGKFWCDCKTRNIRKWLYIKLYGQPERLSGLDPERDMRQSEPRDESLGDRQK